MRVEDARPPGQHRQGSPIYFLLLILVFLPPRHAWTPSYNAGVCLPPFAALDCEKPTRADRPLKPYAVSTSPSKPANALAFSAPTAPARPRRLKFWKASSIRATATSKSLA